MTTWIGFLRAINLGGHRKFSPKEIVSCLEAAGFTDVATHINTGNVRVTTRMRKRERVRDAMERAFLADRGFEVPVALLTPAEVRAVADELDTVAPGYEGTHYVSLLRDAPPADALAALEAVEHHRERLVVSGRAVHLLLGPDFHTSTLGNGAVERLAGPATARNRRVISAIAHKWC